MDIYFNSKKNLDFKPFKKEQDPGIKVFNKWQVFLRKVFALFCADSIFRFNPNGQKNYSLSKKEAIEWVNRHSDASHQIQGKIGNKALLARIEEIYDSKIAVPSSSASPKSSSSTKQTSISTPPPKISPPKPEKGGFSNAGMTSYLSMALQYLDTILLSLPAMPTENDIVQMPGESIDEFNARKQAACEILKMLEKVNSGKNCSILEMSNLRTLLNKIDPLSFPPLNTGGDAWLAHEALAILFFPDHAPFVHKAASAMIHIPHVKATINNKTSLIPDIKTAFKNSLAPLGQSVAKDEGPCDVNFVFQQLNKPFPYFHSLSVRHAATPGKDLPRTIELADEKQGTPNARYELVGFTISGADHSFIGLEKGKWVQYESENIGILSDSEAKKIFNDQKFDMVLYRRVS